MPTHKPEWSSLYTGIANVCELIWHWILTQSLTSLNETESVEHLFHQWHIKTITDSVWRKILQGNTQPCSLCAFKSSLVFTEACMPNWLPPALGTRSGFPLAESEHTVQHSGYRCVTSPVASLSPSLTATIWLHFNVKQGRSPPAPLQRQNLWWESVGKVVPLFFSLASTIWLVKQIALSSCSPICLLSWVLCATATTMPQFPPLLCFCSHTIRMAILVAPVSGKSRRRQFTTYAIKDLYCSFKVLVIWYIMLLLIWMQVSRRYSVL